jgi:hypothetical protein
VILTLTLSFNPVNNSCHADRLAFYGLGMNNPQTIAKIWNIAPANATAPQRWNTEYNTDLSIFQDLIRSGAHALVVVSIGAVLGGFLLIISINHLNRKKLQWGGFLGLFIVFIILGTSFKRIVQTQFHGAAITLYVISQILFYFGKPLPPGSFPFDNSRFVSRSQQLDIHYTCRAVSNSI